MLLVMTYEAGLFIAIVAAFVVGSFIETRILRMWSQSECGCPTPSSTASSTKATAVTTSPCCGQD